MNQKQYDDLLAEHNKLVATLAEPQIAAKRPDYGIAGIVEAMLFMAAVIAVAFAISPAVGTIVAVYAIWKAVT